VVDSAQANFIRSTEYDAFGRATQTTDARLNVRKQTYDRLGRVVTTTVDPGAGHLNLGTTTAYDAFSRVLTQRDAMGATTTYSYDAATRSLKVTTPEGFVLTTVKNRLGEVQSVNDGRGKTTSYLYDKDGNLKQVDAPAVGPTVNTYDKADLLTQVDANGTSTVYEYDAAGRVHTRTVDPGHLNLVTTYEYDAKGQGISVKDAKQVVTQTEFDLKGQVKSVTVDPGNPAAGFLNLTTTYAYDGRGKTLTVTEGAGSAKPRVTLYTYDKLGRLLSQQVDPNFINATTIYVYDKNNNVAKKTDANGNATRFIYDADGRLVYTIDALGGVTKNDYDADGRVIRTTAYAAPLSGFAGLPDVATLANISLNPPTGVDEVTGHVYDKDGRERYIIQIIDGLGNVTQKDYDANGNVVRTVGYAVAIPAGTPLTKDQFDLALAPQQGAAANRVTRTAYDGANRAVYEIDAKNYVKETRYDDVGHVTKTVQYALPVSVGDTPNIAEVAAALSTDSTPLGLLGTTGSYASAPDSVKNSVTGDIDMRVLLTHDSWAPATAEEFITKDDLAASRDTRLRFTAAPPESSSSSAASTARDDSHQRGEHRRNGLYRGLRRIGSVTRNLDGDVKFFTSGDYNARHGNGTWTRSAPRWRRRPALSTTVRRSCTRWQPQRGGFNDLPFERKIYYAEVRSGIDGTLAAKFNPSADAASAASGPTLLDRRGVDPRRVGGSFDRHARPDQHL
jgi:YD repeat-containing protein